MPGIHPSSRQQVRWAFAAEARGKFPKGMAREWAHRYKCWTWPKGQELPKDCKDAVELLDKIRTEHPHWKVPAGVTRAAPGAKPRLVPAPKPKAPPKRKPEVIVFPAPRREVAQAARIARAPSPPKLAVHKTGKKKRPGGVVTAEELVRQALANRR